MLQLVPMEAKFKYKKQIIRERKLNNKIQSDVTMVDMRVLSTTNDQELSKEIFQKRVPLYDINNYTTFFSKNF